jgi:hypothetical protein
MFRRLLNQLYWPAVFWGVVATIILAVLIIVGSRNLADFDAALVGYTFACLFALFGTVYRYVVWLSKPPTRRYWHRGWQLVFAPSLWRLGERARMLVGGIWHKIVFQSFIIPRGRKRWLGHMLLAWGVFLGFAITFPLVFGWIHFQQAAIEPEQRYRVMFFGFPTMTIRLSGLISWSIFHGLVISSFMVMAGVMIVMWRRMFDLGAVAVERFGRDLLPLIMLFAVAASGMLLWISYEWFNGQFYNALAIFHAITVIAFLVYLPFGKLFHIFQRPASLGVEFYRAVGEMGEPAVCPVTGESFASQMQTNDLRHVLPELGFNYEPAPTEDGQPELTATRTGARSDTELHSEITMANDSTGAAQSPPRPDTRAGGPPVRVPAWNEISPTGRRMLIGRAHNAVRRGKFD